MDERQENLLKIAQSLIGTHYKYAAKPEEIPQYLDCSSFTQYIYKQVGIDIPRSTILQAAHAGTEIQSTTNNRQLTTNLMPGDLLFFRGSKGHYDDALFPNRKIYIGHVAMYAGNNNVIHGSSLKGKVVEENLQSVSRRMGKIIIIKRFL
jgi:cell wall-associated NlpC family hydrolase